MSVILRAACTSDAATLAAVYLDVLRDGRGTVVAPDDAPDAAAMAERIGRDGEMWVVEVDGVVVGEGTLTPFEPRWLRHGGVLAMHVHPSAQGRGLGRTLLRALLERARPMGLARVELYVRADNARAIHLYRSEGFVLEGVRRAFVRVRGRPAVDDLVMARFSHPPRTDEVVALVVRRDRGADELLVYRTPNGEGLVPRGLPAPGERPEDAVLRHLAEASGLTEVRRVVTLPPWNQPQPQVDAAGLPVLCRRHPFVLEPTSGLPESWVWRSASGDETPLFRHRWQPLDEVCLHPAFAETLARLRAELRPRSG